MTLRRREEMVFEVRFPSGRPLATFFSLSDAVSSAKESGGCWTWAYVERCKSATGDGTKRS